MIGDEEGGDEHDGTMRNGRFYGPSASSAMSSNARMSRLLQNVSLLASRYPGESGGERARPGVGFESRPDLLLPIFISSSPLPPSEPQQQLFQNITHHLLSLSTSLTYSLERTQTQRSTPKPNLSHHLSNPLSTPSTSLESVSTTSCLYWRSSPHET